MAIKMTPMNKKILFICFCFGFFEIPPMAVGRKGRELKKREGITIFGDVLTDPRELFSGKIADDTGTAYAATHGDLARVFF